MCDGPRASWQPKLWICFGICWHKKVIPCQSYHLLELQVKWGFFYPHQMRNFTVWSSTRLLITSTELAITQLFSAGARALHDREGIANKKVWTCVSCLRVTFASAYVYTCTYMQSSYEPAWILRLKRAHQSLLKIELAMQIKHFFPCSCLLDTHH